MPATGVCFKEEPRDDKSGGECLIKEQSSPGRYAQAEIPAARLGDPIWEDVKQGKVARSAWMEATILDLVNR